MTNRIFPKLIFAIVALFNLILIALILLYLPFAFPKHLFQVEEYSLYNPPEFYFVEYANPFQPEAAIFIPLSDEEGYLIKEESFNRTGLFSFTEVSKEIQGFEQFTDKIYAENFEDALAEYIIKKE